MYRLGLVLWVAAVAAQSPYDSVESRYPGKPTSLSPLYTPGLGAASHAYRDNSYEDNAVTPTPAPTPIYRSVNLNTPQQVYPLLYYKILIFNLSYLIHSGVTGFPSFFSSGFLFFMWKHLQWGFLVTNNRKKGYSPFGKTVKNCKMSSKSVTNLLENSQKLKNALKKDYGPSGKKSKIEKCPQKGLQSFWENRKKLKNVLKRRYGSSGKKSKTEKCPQKGLRSFWKQVKNGEMPSKRVTVLLDKSQKLKNALKKGYGTSGNK